MKIILASPRGFCAGVKRAINIVSNALKIYGPPIYVLHEIVHNSYVVDSLHKQGAIFIEEFSEVPENSILIFSAHGVSQKVRQQAKSKNLTVFDATCPLVMKVHMKVARASNLGKELILIGYAGHPEVKGTMGQYTNQKGGIYLIRSPEDVLKLNVINDSELSFVTQTTFSVDETLNIVNALRKRFPKIIGSHKNDICYATVNRQNAVKKLAKQSEVVLVIGSKKSSNSNRLAEVAKHICKTAFLINDASEIKNEWIKNINCIGVTAAASAPEILIQDVISYLQIQGGNKPIILKGASSEKEDVFFNIPKELRINAYEIK